LAAGCWVICDRFADSTLAYQGYGRGIARAALDGLRQLAVGALVPDLTIILDLPVEVGLARAHRRAGKELRFETMDRDFHERLRRGFLEIAGAEPDRCAVIDGTAAVEDVGRAVAAIVTARLGLALTPA
jgi:dTMP kinase